MARKKVTPKAPTTASSRTTAAVFQDMDAEKIEETTEDPVAVVENGDKPGLEPYDHVKFPLSLVYDVQDLLNDHLSFRNGVQLMVVLYLCQIGYLALSKADEHKELLSLVGFNILGAAIAMWLSHRSLSRRHTADPEIVKKPSLPEFNTLYAIFIPILLTVLLSDPKSKFLQVNLALTNFAIKSLHPAAKVVSAFAFYYIYNDSETLEFFEFLQVVWIYFSVEWALNLWNEDVQRDDEGNVVSVSSTLITPEIHLIGVLIVNLICNFTLPLSEETYPLVIVRILLIALVASCAVTFPLYYLYKNTEKGVPRAGLSVLMVGVFGGLFYFVTNYLFSIQVASVEVITWLYNYILLSELRVHLLAGWVAALVVAVPIVVALSQYGYLSLNARRKIWHFALVASLAYPAMVLEPTFTAIAVLGSVFVFIILEFVRGTKITAFGGFLNKQLRLFQDEKDLKGPFNLSYIFLLLGVAVPIAYGVAVGDVVSIRSYLGLVTLGLGDSMASIVGNTFGKIKWKGGSRTFEGTVTYTVVTFASLVLIDFFILPEESRVKNWENVFIVALVGGALEGAASLNDNILIPCMTLIAYELLGRVF